MMGGAGGNMMKMLDMFTNSEMMSKVSTAMKYWSYATCFV